MCNRNVHKLSCPLSNGKCHHGENCDIPCSYAPLQSCQDRIRPNMRSQNVAKFGANFCLPFIYGFSMLSFGLHVWQLIWGRIFGHTFSRGLERMFSANPRRRTQGPLMGHMARVFLHTSGQHDQYHPTNRAERAWKLQEHTTNTLVRNKITQ